MVSKPRIEIEKFNGNNFELWNLKIEDIFVNRELWLSMHSVKKPTRMPKDDWGKLERKERSTIRLFLSDSVLLNISGEDSAVKIWEKLGILSQSKSLVNKLFFQKKLFHLRMDENDNVTENFNVYNTILCQITSVVTKMAEEDKCITLLCSFPNSWDNLIVAIGSASQATLKFDEIVSSLL